MLNPFQLLDPWMMIGGAALLLLIFLAVFGWNSPRRRERAASSTTPATPDGLTTDQRPKVLSTQGTVGRFRVREAAAR